MIKTQYITKTFRDHFAFLIFAILLCGGFQILILSIFSTSDFLKLMELFMKQMPPQMQYFMGEEFIGQFTINGIAAFGYNHPIVLIFFSMIAITLPARHIGGEIENGSLELMLSLPVKRQAIIFSIWIFTIFAMLLLLFACWLGTYWGLHLNPESITLPFTNIFKIGLNLVVLMLTINAYTFLIAAYSREGSKVALRAAGLTLFFYFLGYATKIWLAIQSLKHFTIFTYFQPQMLMTGQASFVKNILVLFSLTLVLLAIAFRRINQRDIPG